MTAKTHLRRLKPRNPLPHLRKIIHCIKCKLDFIQKKGDEDRVICRRCLKKTMTLLKNSQAKGSGADPTKASQ